MDRRIFNPNFDINAKCNDMMNVSKRIIEHHEFVSDGSCEPPMSVCLAYDVKNYLPKLLKENEELKKQLEEINDFINKAGFVNIQQLMLDYCAKVEQQKEFIEWLEEKIKQCNKLLNTGNPKPYGEERNLYENSLLRYTEILNIIKGGKIND